jgi:Zn-finger nucleic acid-binding protein
MILACPGCDGRYDVTGYPLGQQFRCRCGTIITLEAPSPQAGLLTCPHCGAGVSPSCTACSHCSHALLLKACPRCLSRVFHGHKHCPDCGAELSLVATAEPTEERACPRCGETLGARLVEDIVVDECMGCRGLFLDQVAVKRIVTDRAQARAEALLGAIPKLESPSAIPANGKLYIKCPVCQVVMNRRLFAAGSGIIVDVCRTHGTYFDAGELPRIIEFVMNGGLEQAQKRDLERQREQLRRERDRAAGAAMTSAGASAAFTPTVSSRGAADALVNLLFSLFK